MTGLEFGFLVMTFHHQNDPTIQKQFKNCVGDCQAIINPILEIRQGENSVFGGLNSIGEMMVGVRRTTKLEGNWYFTIGAYYQNNSKYEDKGIDMRISQGDLVPIVGLDYRTTDYGFMFSPVLSTFYINF